MYNCCMISTLSKFGNDGFYGDDVLAGDVWNDNGSPHPNPILDSPCLCALYRRHPFHRRPLPPVAMNRI